MLAILSIHATMLSNFGVSKLMLPYAFPHRDRTNVRLVRARLEQITFAFGVQIVLLNIVKLTELSVRHVFSLVTKRFSPSSKSLRREVVQARSHSNFYPYIQLRAIATGCIGWGPYHDLPSSRANHP